MQSAQHFTIDITLSTSVTKLLKINNSVIYSLKEIFLLADISWNVFDCKYLKKNRGRQLNITENLVDYVIEISRVNLGIIWSKL